MEDGILNVRAFGAQGDGKADDSAAIQKAVDEAGAVGFAPTEDLKQIDGFQSRSQLRVGANALG